MGSSIGGIGIALVIAGAFIAAKWINWLGTTILVLGLMLLAYDRFTRGD